jgi:hypothetical protein
MEFIILSYILFLSSSTCTSLENSSNPKIPKSKKIYSESSFTSKIFIPNTSYSLLPSSSTCLFKMQWCIEKWCHHWLIFQVRNMNFILYHSLTIKFKIVNSYPFSTTCFSNNYFLFILTIISLFHINLILKTLETPPWKSWFSLQIFCILLFPFILT